MALIVKKQQLNLVPEERYPSRERTGKKKKFRASRAHAVLAKNKQKSLMSLCFKAKG